jgi:hypothetical protein
MHVKSVLQEIGPFFSIQEDGWTRFSRHFCAVKTGSHGSSAFLGCYDIAEGIESADKKAAIGCDPDLGARHPDIPEGKVAAMTSDTAKVMPATAREVTTNYDLCAGMVWIPCACHVLDLFLVDQMKIDSIKMLLKRGNAIVNTFRQGSAHKLFLTVSVVSRLLLCSSLRSAHSSAMHMSNADTNKAVCYADMHRTIKGHSRSL